MHFLIGFSAALRCGLIEAFLFSVRRVAGLYFPQRYAAASLKPALLPNNLASVTYFPQRYAAASLKHNNGNYTPENCRYFPQRYAAASLKPVHHHKHIMHKKDFPQRYAAASLKLIFLAQEIDPPYAFSEALRFGLIEAVLVVAAPTPVSYFPKRYASASLKP